MFLLETRSARIELTDGRQMRAVAREVHSALYQGLVEHMLDAAERAAELETGTLGTEWLAPLTAASARRTVPEVFFSHNSVFVLAPAADRVDVWEVRRSDRASTLDDFCAAVTGALSSLGTFESDGDPDGDPDVEWRPRSIRRDRSPTDDDDTDSAEPLPEWSDDDRATAHALADDDARSMIAELVRTGSAITDFDEAPSGGYRSVGELHDRGLIEREYMIVCRQDHRTLGRVSAMDDETRQSILQLSCPTCRRRFDEELLRQVHRPTEAAVELVSDGSWRETWATNMLTDRGIDRSSINRMEGAGGNGRALKVDALQGRLLIELPDAEFGMQHAYAMIRRLRRQQTEFGLVLATEPVADEAYQYLGERVSQQQGPMISVLESSRAIAQGIGDAIDEWSVIAVRLLAEELMDATGLDFGAVIEAWMRREATRSDETGEVQLGDLEDGGADGGGATVTELSRAYGR